MSMMKKYFFASVALAVAIAGTGVSARSNKVDATVIPSGRSVSIAARALEVAPHVFDLGDAVDPQSGRLVHGYAIVKYKGNTGNAKGGSGGGHGSGVGTTDPSASCYTFMASGAKWKQTEPWMVNPSNTEGMDDQYIFDTLSNAIASWEDAADGTLNGSEIDILGNGSITNTFLNPNEIAPNGNNEVVFDSVTDNGAIAVTIVWGIFGGRPQNRELVEWDQIYDQADFDWSSTTDPTKMNFANIGTHELGHSFGLGDLYQTECADQTMYGYGTEGETQKVTLEAGDIAGVSALY